MSGTSTGGIISLALSVGTPTNVLVELYAEKGEEIFVTSWFSTDYSPHGLKALRKKYLGTNKVKDAKTDIAITSC